MSGAVTFLWGSILAWLGHFKTLHLGFTHSTVYLFLYLKPLSYFKIHLNFMSMIIMMVSGKTFYYKAEFLPHLMMTGYQVLRQQRFYYTFVIGIYLYFLFLNWPSPSKRNMMFLLWNVMFTFVRHNNIYLVWKLKFYFCLINPWGILFKNDFIKDYNCTDKNKYKAQ